VLKNSKIYRLTILPETKKYLCVFLLEPTIVSLKIGRDFCLDFFYELIYSGIQIGGVFMILTKFYKISKIFERKNGRAQGPHNIYFYTFQAKYDPVRR
jgi:hypothetical protein